MAFITTEDLKEKYGYEHPPRAARDVRERGVNLLTYKVKSSDGRNIAAYKFGKPVFLDDKVSKKAGRTALSKAFEEGVGRKIWGYLFRLFTANAGRFASGGS